MRCLEDGDGGACLWGKVEAYDGFGVQIRGHRLQLMGIVEPRHRDLCVNKTSREEFDCARLARKRMGELLARGGVACDILDVAGDRLVGRCRVAEGDLARLLVGSGVVRAAKDGLYEAEQVSAVTQQKGLWAADILPPHDWEIARKKGEKD